MSAAGKVMLIALTAAVLVAGCKGRSAQERYLERANRFFERERYAEAIVSYLSVLQKDPGNTEAIRQLGLAYYHADDPVRAFPLLQEAVNREPERTDLKIKLAQLYIAGGVPDEARALAEDVLEKEPDNLEALVILADASLAPEEVEAGLARLASMKDVHAAESRYHLALGALNLRKGEVGLAEKALSEAIRLAPDDPDAYVARGELFRLKGDREAARADLLKAYTLAPPLSMAGLRWAIFNRTAGRADEARKVLEAMLAASPRFLPALYERAAMDAAEQRIEESLAGLEQALAINPRHLPSLLLRARIKLLQGQIDESEKMLQEVTRDFPDSPAARVEMARVQLRKGQNEKAENELREALKRAPLYSDAALALAELEIRGGRHESAIGRLAPLTGPLSSVRSSALLLMGAAQRLNGNWDGSLDAYRQLAELLPQSPEPAFLSGLTCQAAGRMKEAAEAFQRALDTNPAYVPALNRLVAMDLQEGRTNEAVARVDRQIEKNPEAAGLYYIRASIAGQLQDWPTLESSLLKTLQIDPQLSSSYRDLSRLYARQGRIEEAINKLNAAMGINPRDTASLMMMGVLYEQENRMEQAIEAYEKILGINPRFAAAQNNLAYLLASQGRDLDRALELAQQARDAMPADPAVADTLGLVALKRKDYKWARSLLEESAGQLGDEPEVWYHLALARHGLGLEEGAREALARALSVERDFPGRDEARLLLGVLEIPLQKISPADEKRLEQARQVIPDNPSLLVRLGTLHQQEGRRDEAVAMNEKALSIAPDFLPALLNLVWLHEDQPERAVAYGRKARELAPGDPAVAHAVGWAAFCASDYAWSRSLLTEAAAARGKDPDILFRLAQASLMAGRVGDSRREAERAKAAAGDEKVAVAIGDFLRLIEAYSAVKAGTGEAEMLEVAQARDAESALVQLVGAKLSSGEDAKRRYRKLMTLYPSWALPVRDLAALQVAEGLDDQETFDLAKTARERLPEDPAALRSYALALAYRGSAAQAIPILQRVVQADTADGIARYWLAKSMAKEGSAADAVETMRRAVEIGLPAPLDAAAAKLLKELANK